MSKDMSYAAVMARRPEIMKRQQDLTFQNLKAVQLHLIMNG